MIINCTTENPLLKGLSTGVGNALTDITVKGHEIGLVYGNSFIIEPTNEGTAGQVLVTDGKGGRTWQNTSGGYTLPVASLSVLGGIKAGGNAEISADTAQITVTGKRDITMAFADIPTENVPYNELLARVAGYYAEINSRLKVPEKNLADYLVVSDGTGGTTLMGIASEAIEGDTKPISGGAVYKILGDIESLLAAI